jgi:hypothetical protein
MRILNTFFLEFQENKKTLQFLETFLEVSSAPY